MARIARNDPCPCGSGKKHKKCCLGKTGLGQEPEASRISDFAYETILEAERRLLQRLADMVAQDPMWAEERDAAAEEFIELLDDPKMQNPDEWSEFDRTRLFQWFVFHHRCSDGRSLLERANAALHPRDDLEGEIWQGLLSNPHMLYEVQEVHPGRGFRVKALLGAGQKIDVRDVSASRGLRQWDLLFARVFPVRGVGRIFGGTTRFPQKAKRDLLASLKDLYQHYRSRENPRGNYSDFLRDYEDEVVRLQYDFTRELTQGFPQLQTSDGEPLLFCRANFELACLGPLVQVVRKTPEFTTEELSRSPADEIKPFSLCWLGPEKVIHANLHYDGEKLWGETMSRPRMKRLLELLDKKSKGAVRPKTVVYEDPKKKLEDFPRERTAAPSELEPELQAEIQKHFYSEHYAKWIDMPLPALQGRTPREAGETPMGRELVEDLLKEIENISSDDQVLPPILQSIRGELRLDQPLEEPTLYSPRQALRLLNRVRDANLELVRLIGFGPKIDTRVHPRENLLEINTALSGCFPELLHDPAAEKVQEIAGTILKSEGHLEGARSAVLEFESGADALLFNEPEAFERKLIARFLSEEIRDMEEKPISINAHVQRILRHLPASAVEALAGFYNCEGSNKEERIWGLSWRFQEEGLLHSCVDQLMSHERRALAEILRAGGWISHTKFVRQYGSNYADCWAWGYRYPQSTLGALRFHVLAAVGQSARHGRILLVASDLRGELGEILEFYGEEVG
ncbi:SEC-C domain-containing protein [Acidobacteria bacterium AH-259-O06]|nr:SEC-C domain-containing protein [Acidobacteria bacterium AH-259-O06]